MIIEGKFKLRIFRTSQLTSPCNHYLFILKIIEAVGISNDFIAIVILINSML